MKEKLKMGNQMVKEKKLSPIEQSMWENSSMVQRGTELYTTKTETSNGRR